MAIHNSQQAVMMEVEELRSASSTEGPPLGEAFRLLAEAVPQLVWVAGPDGSWVYENGRLKGLTGCSDADTRGLAWMRLLHPEDLPRWRERWCVGTAAGGPFQAEYRLRGRGGEWREFEVDIRPQRQGAEGEVWWFGSSTEISRGAAPHDSGAQAGGERTYQGGDPCGAVSQGAATVGIAELEVGSLRFLHANPAFCSLVGLDLEALTAPDASAWVHPEDLHSTAPVELRIVRGAAEVRVLVQLAPSAEEGGAARSFFAVAVDLIRQRSAMEALITSEQRFRLAAATSRVMVYDIMLDDSSDARSTFAAVGSSELLGVDPGSLRSLGDWHEHLHPDDVLKWFGGRNALAERGGDATCEYRVRHKDGRWIHVMDRSRVARQQTGDRIIGTVIDISEHKRSEAALEQADRSKNEFIATLGHELRNPLSAMRYAAQLQRALPTSDARLVRCREVIHRQTELMARLLDDLLDVSRIERGKLRLERCLVDLVEVVRHLLDDHAPFMRDRGLQVDEELPRARIWVHADRARLSQAVGNLLTNARKFTASPGRIWVRVSGEGGEARVEIADSGQGIERSFLAHVFEPFQQGEGEREGRGLGLGLSLVRGIAELHGGKVEAQSDGPGRGCRFVLSLPRHLPVGPPDPSDEEEPSRRRVLVVEDNLDSAEVLRDLLELSGYMVRIAVDGASALRICGQLRPEVILCDLSLPGELSGLAVANHARSQPDAPALMIAITGHAGDAIRAEAFASGFHVHLTKPVDVDELIQTIEARVGGR